MVDTEYNTTPVGGNRQGKHSLTALLKAALQEITEAETTENEERTYGFQKRIEANAASTRLRVR